MKVQGNRYINNPEMIKNKVEKKTTVPQNIISEDDVKISDSARKLVETARNKVSRNFLISFSNFFNICSFQQLFEFIITLSLCQELFYFLFSRKNGEGGI